MSFHTFLNMMRDPQGSFIPILYPLWLFFIAIPIFALVFTYLIVIVKETTSIYQQCGPVWIVFCVTKLMCTFLASIMTFILMTHTYMQTLWAADIPYFRTLLLVFDNLLKVPLDIWAFDMMCNVSLCGAPNPFTAWLLIWTCLETSWIFAMNGFHLYETCRSRGRSSFEFIQLRRDNSRLDLDPGLFPCFAYGVDAISARRSENGERKEERLDQEEKAEFTCSICMTVPCKGEPMTRFPYCNHMFHRGCLEGWHQHCLPSVITCPLCRQPALEDCRESKELDEQTQV